MNKTKTKYIVIFTITLIILAICTNVKAAGMGLSINKSTATVGDTFSVTISGINGRVSISGNSNVAISPSGTQWVEGSLTITGTAKSAGTGTVTVTPLDASTTAAEPQEVTDSASRSITINEVPKVETPATPEPTAPTPTPATKVTETAPTSTPTSTTTTKTTTTTTTKKTETKTETPKTETKKEEKTKEDNFYINSIIIKGLKETGEQIDIALSPEFAKNVYEYTCNIPADVQRIDIQKDAGEFTNSVIETGLEELKEGENTITLQLLAEDHQAKTYTIKAIKEKKEQVEETNEAETTGAIETSAMLEEQKQEEQAENKEENQKMVSMPIIKFILMQIAIIAIEILIIKCVPWSKIIKFSKH